jgi:hypothetical protein
MRTTGNHITDWPLEGSSNGNSGYSQSSNLFFKYAPQSHRQKRPEMWEDPLTAQPLGIDENDLWTAAQAVEHNLVLITSDKLLRLRDADHDGRLLIENWTKPPGAAP